MRTSFLPLVVATISLVTSSLTAQEAKVPARRAASGPVPPPEIRADGGVTFRYRSTKAAEVKVAGQIGPETALTKGEDGLWSGTVPNVKPGVYEYRLVVDGVNLIDPANPAVKPQRWPGVSILHLPANPPAPWDLQDIPHGTLHEHTYKSKALDRWRHVVIYTPPNASALGRLPVLYLAHGYSDNEGTWTVHGKAHWILDSLIAARKAVPMIVVMPDAHALPPESGGAFDQYGPENSAAFCRELIQDLIPLVETNYRVAARARSRAFAGLSMGGHHALTVALNHHDLFGWIGAFSSAPPPTELIAAGLMTPAAVNRDLRLFWIACGGKDFLIKNNETFVAMLKEKQIRHEYVLTEGDHSWPVWRNYLTEFAPKLFR